jgi:lipopolysaccharide/colanic/teichoic acid biosynthesis glycosyltransferase
LIEYTVEKTPRANLQNGKVCPRLESALTGNVLDLVLILFTLPTWLTVMICIALWIKITSPGPVSLSRNVGFQEDVL